MSLSVQLNHPAAAAISDSPVQPIHDGNHKIYVACRNVAVQTEEIRGDELHEAEVVHDGDIFLKVFYNANGEAPVNHYANEQYWLNRHARQKKTFFLDVSDDEDDEYYSNIYQPNSFMDPKSVVWRKCYNAKLIDFNAVFANAVSGLRACDIAVQTVPEQVAGDSFYTDEDLFNEKSSTIPLLPTKISPYLLTMLSSGIVKLNKLLHLKNLNINMSGLLTYLPPSL